MVAVATICIVANFILDNLYSLHIYRIHLGQFLTNIVLIDF